MSQQTNNQRIAEITQRAILAALENGPLSSIQIANKTGFGRSTIDRHLYEMITKKVKLVHICDYRFMNERGVAVNGHGRIPAVYELGDFPNVKKNAFIAAESKRLYKRERRALIKLRESRRPSPFPT